VPPETWASEPAEDKQTLLRLDDPSAVDRLGRLASALAAGAPVFLLASFWIADGSEALSRIAEAAGMEGLLFMALAPAIVATVVASVGYFRLDPERRQSVRSMPAALVLLAVVGVVFFAFFALPGFAFVPEAEAWWSLAPLAASGAALVLVLLWRLRPGRDSEGRAGRAPLLAWSVSVAFEAILIVPWWAADWEGGSVRPVLGLLMGVAALLIVANVWTGLLLIRSKAALPPLPRWAGLVNQFALQPWILAGLIAWWALAFAFSGTGP
jgi:hypothetical protein